METYPDLIVCERCEALSRRRSLSSFEVANCRQCSMTLERGGAADADRWLALVLTAGVAYGMTILCPVVRVGIEGIYNESTVWASVMSLGRGAGFPVAVIAAMVVVVVPGLQLGLLLWLVSFARAGRKAPGFAWGVGVLNALQPWSMVEISMTGALVTVVKLSSHVEIAPLAGAWAMLVLAVCFALIKRRDVRSLWDITGRPHDSQRKSAG